MHVFVIAYERKPTNSPSNAAILLSALPKSTGWIRYCYRKYAVVLRSTIIDLHTKCPEFYRKSARQWAFNLTIYGNLNKSFKHLWQLQATYYKINSCKPSSQSNQNWILIVCKHLNFSKSNNRSVKIDRFRFNNSMLIFITILASFILRNATKYC